MNYFTTSDNTKIFYKVEGEGTPILFIHGFTATHDVYRIPQKVLSKNYKVITFDLRGHGLSNKSNMIITLSRLAYDLKELVEYLDLDNILLVGWSLGGSVIFEYISMFGSYRITKLCLIDTSPKVLNEENWKLGLYHGEYSLKEALSDLDIMRDDWGAFSYKFIDNMAPKLDKNQINIAAARMQNNDPDKMLQIWNSLINRDYRSILNTIEVPTMLIFGGKSTLYSIEVGKYMNNLIKGSELLIFESNSHLLVQENPTRINRVLSKFIYY